MPRKYKRLAPKWKIKERLDLRDEWKENREGMLLRSKRGNVASQKKRKAMRDRLISIFSTMPKSMSKEDMMERVVAFMVVNDTRRPESIIRRLMNHKLLTYDPDTGLWINHSSILPNH